MCINQSVVYVFFYNKNATIYSLLIFNIIVPPFEISLSFISLSYVIVYLFFMIVSKVIHYFR